MKKNTLVLIYNSFGDPLFQNLMLTYIKTLSEKADVDFHLVTFEQPQYHLDEEERSKWKAQLIKNRIFWHPLTFHTGRFLLLKKLWDFMAAFVVIIYLKFHFKLKYIFCFANVSASIGIVIAKVLRMKTIIYSYEPHSDFQVELGLWSGSGLKYKLLNRLENYAGMQADYIMTGTQHMVDQLMEQGSKAKLFRAPTAVDPQSFDFRPESRQRIRDQLGIQADQQVILYVGKFGGLYYTYEIAELFHEIKTQIQNSFFMIVTSNDHSEIRDMLVRYISDEDFYLTGNLSYEELKDYLSAADMGVSGVPPSPSQKFRSPTKVAEYLLCGLPYITTKGVSEDDEVAEKNNVGLAITRFGKDSISVHSLKKLENLLLEPKELLRGRCRNVGLEYRSKKRIDEILFQIYS